MPISFHKDIVKLYPDEELYARETEIADGVASLQDTNTNVMEQIEKLLLEYIQPKQYYRCA